MHFNAFIFNFEHLQRTRILGVSFSKVRCTDILEVYNIYSNGFESGYVIGGIALL